jgi:signal transduction histidine kinase
MLLLRDSSDIPMDPLASLFSCPPIPLHLRPGTMEGLEPRLGAATHASGKPAGDPSFIDLDESPGSALQIDLLWSLVAHYKSALLENEQQCARLRAENRETEQALVRAEATQKAAEEAVAGQAHFLAVIAHELRGPLAAVSYATAAVGRRAPSDIERARIHAIIQRQVEHASRLIEDLVDLTRARTGKLRLAVGLVDVRDVIHAAVGICRHAMVRRSHTFAVEVPSSALPVLGDSVRLTQVLNNLLENASRYTPERGVIMLSVAVVDDFCVLTVTDSGIGMTAEGSLVAFDALSQEAHAVAFNSDGLGIGLAIARELVEAHGGTVTGRSEGQGRGSQFIVSLPLVQTPAIKRLAVPRLAA